MGTLGAVGVALAALLIAPGLASPASAAPVPLGSSAPQQWAYGADKWVNVTVTLPNATYASHAHFGWQVIFTATNTSASTVMLEAQRTMSGSFTAELCAPNCTHPNVHGTLNVTGWSTATGFANLTTAATVYENGSAVAAFGLQNAQAVGRANLSERMALTLPILGVPRTTTSSFFADASSHASVAFTPALGLVPVNLTNDSSWNSSSAFSAAGGWSIAISDGHTPFVGAGANGSFFANGSVNASGTVFVHGHDFGTITLANGMTVPAVGLVLTGPFDDLDGAILMPHDADLFGDGAHGWGADELGGETVFTSNVDVGMDGFHHVRFVAASSAYSATDASLGSSAGMAPMGPTPAATSASPTYVQAQPESVATAQQRSGCLVSACPSAAPGLLGPGALVAGLVIGLAAVAALGAIGAVAYRRRTARRTSAGPAPSDPPRGATLDPTSVPGQPPRAP